MMTATVTSDFQVKLSPEILQQYSIHEGSEVRIEATENGIVIAPTGVDFINSCVGKYKDVTPTTEEYFGWKREERELEEAKMRRIFGE